MNAAPVGKDLIAIQLSSGNTQHVSPEEAEKLIDEIRRSVNAAKCCWAELKQGFRDPHGGHTRRVYCDRYRDHSDDRSDKRHSATFGSYGVQVTFRWEDPNP